MSWQRRSQVALFAIVSVGIVLLFVARGQSGWSSLTYFASGMVLSVGGLLLNLIVCVATAFLQPKQRSVSIWLGAISLIMLLGLALLWRAA